MGKSAFEINTASAGDLGKLNEELLAENAELRLKAQVLKEECNSLKVSLEESNRKGELFRMMGETLPYGIWMCDNEGKAKYMSQSFLDLLAMSLEEAQEFGWSQRLKPGTEQAMTGKWLDCIKTGSNWDHEHIISGPDGKYHTVLTRGRPVKDENGNITSWVGINLDIDERKEIELDLISTKDRFEVLVNTANELLKSTDIQSSVQTICHNLMEHLNCQVFFNFIDAGKNKLYLNAYEGIPKEEAEKIRYLDYGSAICGCVARDGQGIVAEHVQTNGDERADLVRSYGVKAYASFPLLSEGGSVIGTLSFGTTKRDTFNQSDISLIEAVTDQVAISMIRMNDQKLMSETLNELARSNKELEQFAYIASHDLQEPLRVLAGFSRLLANKYAGRLDEKADEYINFITESTRRMQSLISDLLSYARLTSKALPYMQVDLNSIVDEVLRDLQLIIKESSTEIIYDSLPVISADPMQIKQVLQNLLQNAIKFRLGPTPIIQISSEMEGNMWKIAVKDNGMGISPEYFERIFIIFHRLHERDKYPGTGIGLALCKKIIERHGGRIWVESEEGKGSVFYFTIPV